MEKQETLVVTGRTEQQAIDEMRVLEFSEKQGLKAPSNSICYLCKRAEGEKSVYLSLENEDSIITNEIILKPWTATLSGEVTYIYKLCHECALLLCSMGMTDEDLE